VIVLIGAMLPLSLEQRYAIPRTWGLLLTWLAGVVCGLRYTIEGREKPARSPFISLWKHSSAWETMAQMFVVPPASWLLKREVLWIPIVGWAVRTYKPIAINRSAGHAAVNQVVAQGRERLASGMGVIVYPEGTRVTPGASRKYGSVAHCSRARPARPWCRSRTRQAISGAGAAAEKAGHDRVVIGPAIDPAGLTTA
jgi:1-acyl-sn-glycerol-3-phosphate acyltransferase